MKHKTPINPNYSATVVEIKTLVSLDNCDNVQGAMIFGNQVIVSNETKVGDIGLYFPLETQLSSEYLSKNNLYRHSENNEDKKAKGYFEDNGRIRCVKFRGHNSQGLFMPISSVSMFLGKSDKLALGDDFDFLNGKEICKKYIVKTKNTNPNSNKQAKQAKESKILDNQFRFHDDTSMLYRNLDKIDPTDLISITYKMHGTSGISANVLCKKPLSMIEKILIKFGVDINTKSYDNIYASRRVVKNPDLNPNAVHFYSDDIWGLANAKLKDVITEGITLYYEIVGFLPSGEAIQKGFDYGFKAEAKDETFGIFVHRITSTSYSGKVIEFSKIQVKEWCKRNGVNVVPELYYGYACDFPGKAKDLYYSATATVYDWRELFLEDIKAAYNEKNCYMCENVVPEEGAVICIENGVEFEAYKQKSIIFYEYETKLLDKGESDIESDN